jgi:hypothetical protein
MFVVVRGGVGGSGGAGGVGGGGGAIAFMLSMISCCNRSEPHCKAIKAALTIMCNIGKCAVKDPSLIRSLACTPEFSETLTTVICNFSKHEQILRPAIYALTVKSKFDLEEGVNRQENIGYAKKLSGVHKLLAVIAAREQKQKLSSSRPSQMTRTKKRKQKPCLPALERLLKVLSGKKETE